MADNNSSLNFIWAPGEGAIQPTLRIILRLGKMGPTVPRKGLPLVVLAVLSARSHRVTSLEEISNISSQAYDLVCRTTEIHSVSGTPAKVN